MPNAPVELVQLLSTFTDDDYNGLTEQAEKLRRGRRLEELTDDQLEAMFDSLSDEGQQIRSLFRGLLVGGHAVRNEQRRRARLRVVAS